MGDNKLGGFDILVITFDFDNFGELIFGEFNWSIENDICIQNIVDGFCCYFIAERLELAILIFIPTVLAFHVGISKEIVWAGRNTHIVIPEFSITFCAICTNGAA